MDVATSILGWVDESTHLKDEHRAVREVARRFAAKALQPFAERMDRDDFFPRDLIREAGQLGLIGIALPEQYGGGGSDLLAAAIVRQELARVSPAFGAAVVVSGMYFGYNLWRLGSVAQCEMYLPEIASGEKIGAWALTEQDAGSDARSLRTTSTVRDTDIVLNGAKQFITNGPVADYMIVLTRDCPGGERDEANEYRAVLLETNVAGVELGPPLDKVGLRGSPTGPVYFNDVVLPRDAVIGRSCGFEQLVGSLQMERAMIVFAALGISTRCLDEATEYAVSRRQFGREIGQFQLIQEKLASIAMAVGLLQSYGLCLMEQLGEKNECNLTSAIGKLAAGQLALQAATDAMQVFGGYGYMRENTVQRLWRDARLLSIAGGTEEIQKVVIGKSLTQRARYQERVLAGAEQR
jgi:isovaleryl-CoA dehydrogenase